MYAVSLSTLAVAGYAWQPLWGGHSFVVIAKATFQLLPGKARLADVQDDLNLVDNHWDDDANCSVYAPSDMAPFKERADVMLVGDAFAPTARGSKSLVARVSVGNMSKSLVVFSDRCIDQRGRISHGERFNRMALRYERATASDVNPVGIAPGCVKGQPLPNLQAVPRKQSDAERVDTACFAPIAARWPTRQRLLGSAAAGWDETAWRHTPLPCQVDTTYFNASPADQRVDEIRCDERIVLNHLHPQHARLVSHLPGMQPRAFVERCAAVRPVSLRADSLWIDTTRGICTVTWRGSVELQAADEPGRVLVAHERAAEHLTWPDVEAAMSAGATLIDSRGAAGFAKGHIPGAINIPAGDDAAYATLPEDKSTQVVFYCSGPACGASTTGAQKALSLGYTKVGEYRGGYPAWATVH